MEVTYVPLDRLRPKIRLRRDLGDIDALAKSLQENGLLEPLIVSENGEGEFGIICGMRRYYAAKKAGLKEISVINIGKVSLAKALELIWDENELRKRLAPDERCFIITLLVDKYGVRQVSRMLNLSPSTVETMSMAGRTFAGVLRVVRSSDTPDTPSVKYRVKIKLAEEICRVLKRANYEGNSFKEVAGRAYLSLIDFPTRIASTILKEWATNPTLDHLNELIQKYRKTEFKPRPAFGIPELEERVPLNSKCNFSFEKLLLDVAWDRRASYRFAEKVSINIIEFNDTYVGVSSLLCPRCNRPLRCRVCGAVVCCLCGYPHSFVRHRKYRYAALGGAC